MWEMGGVTVGERVTSDDPLVILFQRKSHGVPLCPLTESSGPGLGGSHRL